MNGYWWCDNGDTQTLCYQENGRGFWLWDEDDWMIHFDPQIPPWHLRDQDELRISLALPLEFMK